ncbi:Gfo/Idh/MocA family oxidoreductase [Brucella sp. BE17]|uniref:Gfo/Idh/MocA family protein n=1 Tax=Brucella sp. BE17 TaxID=3142977 RepID=UPI0031BB9348
MGTETIATEHMVSAIRHIDHEPRWVVSRNLQYAQSFAEDLGVLHASNDLTGVWADPDIRFVYVSATRERRPHYIKSAAKAGKHILCDGPICDDREQAEQLVKLCNDMGVTLAVHHVARASNVLQTLKRLIREGEIGQLQTISIIRGGPFIPPPNRHDYITHAEGDIFFDAALESIDLSRFLSGAEATNAVAIVKKSEHLPLHLAFALQMNDGSIAQIHESFSISEIESTVLVAGSKGSLTATGTLSGRGAGTLTRRVTGRNELIPIRERDVHIAAIQDFVSGVQGKPNWLSTGEDGIANLQAVEAIVKSVNRGVLVEIAQA